MTRAEELPELDSAYESLAPLGRGASAFVVRARERATGREVALKLLSAPPGDRAREARFLREGQLAASLSHPGVVDVHAVGRYQGKLCLAFELVEGARPLDEVARERPLRARVELVRGAAIALGAAHAAGLVHRDVKGANLLVDRQGRVRVTDFGVATGADLERLTLTGALVGTPLYMAPEQLHGRQLGPPTDVWALGVLLYELCCGEPPFSDRDGLIGLIGSIEAGVSRPPRQLAPEVPVALEAVVLRALQHDPAQRQPDGAALAAELGAWLSGATRPGTTARRFGSLLAAAAGLLLVSVGVWVGDSLLAPPSEVPTRPTTTPTQRPTRVDSPGSPSPLAELFVEEREWQPSAPAEPTRLLERRYLGPSSEFLLALEAVRLTWPTGTGPTPQLGEMLLRGTGVGADRQAGLDWFRWGATRGGQTSLEALLTHLPLDDEERLRWAMRGWSRFANRLALSALAEFALAESVKPRLRAAALQALRHAKGPTASQRRVELLCSATRDRHWRRIPLLPRRQAFRLVSLLVEEGWRVEQAAQVLRTLSQRRPARLVPLCRELAQRGTLRAEALLARVRAGALADLPRAIERLRRVLATRPDDPDREVAERQLIELAFLHPDEAVQALARSLAARWKGGLGRLLLGQCHELGCGGARDAERARGCYEAGLRSVPPKQRWLWRRLTRRLLRLQFLLGDHAAGWAHYERLRRAGLRGLLVDGLAEALSHEEARVRATRELRELAKDGEPRAMGLLSQELRQGDHLPRDRAEAWRWAERGLFQGDPTSLYVRGSMLRYGEGRSTDLEAARGLLERAAVRGHPLAMREFGGMLLTGAGGPADRPLGLDFLRQAVEAHDRFAILLLSEALQKGTAAERAEAERWLELGARESRQATLKLAILRREKDPSGAFELARTAAEADLPEAWVLLGDSHRDGVGAAQDLAAARRCYEKALSLGSIDAAQRLRALPR